MSVTFEGLTWPNHIIQPRDDGVYRERVSMNGRLAGFSVSIVSVNGEPNFEVSNGWINLCGRELKLNSAARIPIQTNKNYAFLIANAHREAEYANAGELTIQYEDSPDCPILHKGYLNAGSSDSGNNLYQDVLAAAKRSNGTWQIYYAMGYARGNSTTAAIEIGKDDWQQGNTYTDPNTGRSDPISEFWVRKNVTWAHPDDVILVTYGRGYRSICLNNGVYGFNNYLGYIEIRAATKPQARIYMLALRAATNMNGHNDYNPT